MAPQTRYARNGDCHIAYQTIGDGSIDLLWVPQSFSCVEMLWQHPVVAAFFERIGSWARLIMYDRRESGMSDRLGRPPTLEEQIDDAVAVLDAVGAERAGVLTLMEGGPMAMLLAASRPDRVGALALYSTFARTTRAEGYEWAPTVEERRNRFEQINAHWGDGRMLVQAFAPSHAHDESLVAWLGLLERAAMSPGTARALSTLNEELDVRDILPTIRVPTLVLHRTDAPGIDIRHSLYIAAQIPSARLVELPGRDTFPFLGDAAALHGEIEEFFTGERSSHEPDRRLATVLFTDIVGSTKHAARLGDAAWRERLARHDSLIRRALARHQGQEIKTLGDGFLATFDGPARAIHAGRRIATDIADLGLAVRVGVHVGECEIVPGDVHGLAVHIAARVMEQAEGNEVLVSSTVRDLVVGSGIRFEDRGEHELEGVPDAWRLWKVAA